MKNQRLNVNRAIGAVLSVVCSAVMAFSASAETVNGVTLNISTDKSSYAANENVSISISAKNDNSYSINNVSIKTSIPNGFTVNGNHSTNLTYSTIESGESIQDGFSIYKNTYIDNNPNPNPTPTPTPDDDFIYPPYIPNNDNDDGEDVSAGAGAVVDSEEIAVTKINTGKFAIVFLLSLSAIGGIALLIKNRKNIKKLLSMFLAVGIIIPLCGELGTIDVSAESGSVTAKTTYFYNGQQYDITCLMTYNYDDNSEENEPVINIPDYIPDPEHIITDPESNTMFIDNEIIVYFVNGYTQEMLNEIENQLNGYIVDGSPEIDKYRFRCNNVYSLVELQKICEQLCLDYDYIEYAYWANIFSSDDVTMSYHSDPWVNDGNPRGYTKMQNEPFYWDEAFPCGSNYALELINMPTVWDYLEDKNYPEIKIGVVDMEFSDNSDLLYSFLFPFAADINTDSNSFHGTHVAGIIGAQNNSNGMSGILKNALLYCYDCSQFNSNNNSYFVDDDIAMTRIQQSISNGCRVVNFSIGDNWTNENLSHQDNNLIEKQANAATQLISKMIQNVNDGVCEDFIIVQAAGNCSLDAYNNGYFTAITDKNKLSKDAIKNNITINDIKNKVIVVGNLNYNFSEYKLAESSNFGNSIDICAPGVNILSTGFDNKVYLESGTSMAAPMVTGVCGLVWSISPNLSATQVKDLVTNSFNHTVSDTKGNLYHALNAAEVLKKMKIDISNDLNQGIKIKNGSQKWYAVSICYENSDIEIYNKEILNTYSIKTSCEIPYVITIFDEDSNEIYKNTIHVKSNEWFEIDLDDNSQVDYIATITQYDTPFITNDEIPFTATLRLSDGTIDISDDSGYKVTVDNEDCLTVLDIIEESDKTYTIKTKALKAGTATLTIAFDNGASASSTITIEDATALGGIKGIVQDSETGAPLSDVAISIIDSNNNTLATIYSDESGNFAQNCENGTYSVVFSKDGYITKTVSDVIVADEINDMTTVSLIANIFAGGDGSVENPYQVATAAQLDAVRNNLGANYIQISDIDLSTYNNWEPIGDTLTPFTGTYNGQDYSIQNLTINVTNENDLLSQGYSVKLWNIGLFGEGYNANITNIKLCDVDINVLYSDDSASFMCGSLIGYGFDCHIDNIETSGRIYMEGEFYNIGGISGCGNVSDSINRIAIIIDCGGYDTWGVGGISGCGNANSCVNYGNIDAKFTGVRADNPVIGGIIGEGEDSSNYCTNYGNLKCISGSSWCTVGGVVGDGGDNTITFCKNYGDVSANTLIFSSVSMNGRFNCSAGGVVGTGYNVDISNCYNEGKITSTACGGSVAAGGIAGWIYYLHGEGICQISNCVNKASIESYSIKTESDGTQTISPSSYIGYIGAGECTYSNNYALDSATINSIIPSEDISETEKNGELLSDAELLAKINELILI